MTRRFDILLSPVEDAASREWCWRDDWNISGQSAFMLLAKFQHLNTLSCTALAKMVVRKPASLDLQRGIDLRDAQRFDVRKMAVLLRMSLAAVAAAFPPRHVLLSGGMSNTTVRWCPQCALKGVHLTVFQSAGCDRCPVHGCTLLDRCVKCGSVLMVYRLRATVFRAPFTCPTCGQDWAPALRQSDDHALRLSLSYRQRLEQALARGWFGRRSSAVGRLFRQSARTDESQAWLVSAPRRGVGDDDAKNCYQQISLNQRVASQYLFGWHHDHGDAIQRKIDMHTGVPSRFRMPESQDVDEILMEATACYKSIRRHLMRSIGRGHRACVVTSIRHLTWRLEGRTTTTFCPVAHALLRWRIRWEGVGVPSHLMVGREHAALGILCWLSLLAPVDLAQWSRAVDCWTILHVFVRACLDCFHWYLQEAVNGTNNSRPVWMSFPVVDFPERKWSVLGGAPETEPCQLTFAQGMSDINKIRLSPLGDDHYRQHVHVLNQNVAPPELPKLPTNHCGDVKFANPGVSTDPLAIDRIGGTGQRTMVLAVFAESDAE